MLVAALVLEGLAPGAAPVGGVPVGGVMPDGVVTVDDVLSLDVAADRVEQPTDTASIGTIRSESSSSHHADTYRDVGVTPPKDEPLGWEVCGVAPVEASGDVS
jgi:hypothetical protein